MVSRVRGLEPQPPGRRLSISGLASRLRVVATVRAATWNDVGGPEGMGVFVAHEGIAECVVPAFDAARSVRMGGICVSSLEMRREP